MVADVKSTDDANPFAGLNSQTPIKKPSKSWRFFKFLAILSWVIGFCVITSVLAGIGLYFFTNKWGYFVSLLAIGILVEGQVCFHLLRTLLERLWHEYNDPQHQDRQHIRDVLQNIALNNLDGKIKKFLLHYRKLLQQITIHEKYLAHHHDHSHHHDGHNNPHKANLQNLKRYRRHIETQILTALQDNKQEKGINITLVNGQESTILLPQDFARQFDQKKQAGAFSRWLSIPILLVALAAGVAFTLGTVQSLPLIAIQNFLQTLSFISLSAKFAHVLAIGTYIGFGLGGLAYGFMIYQAISSTLLNGFLRNVVGGLDKWWKRILFALLLLMSLVCAVFAASNFYRSAVACVFGIGTFLYGCAATTETVFSFFKSDPNKNNAGPIKKLWHACKDWLHDIWQDFKQHWNPITTLKYVLFALAEKLFLLIHVIPEALVFSAPKIVPNTQLSHITAGGLQATDELLVDATNYAAPESGDGCGHDHSVVQYVLRLGYLLASVLPVLMWVDVLPKHGYLYLGCLPLAELVIGCITRCVRLLCQGKLTGKTFIKALRDNCSAALLSKKAHIHTEPNEPNIQAFTDFQFNNQENIAKSIKQGKPGKILNTDNKTLRKYENNGGVSGNSSNIFNQTQQTTGGTTGQTFRKNPVVSTPSVSFSSNDS